MNGDVTKDFQKKLNVETLTRKPVPNGVSMSDNLNIFHPTHILQTTCGSFYV